MNNRGWGLRVMLGFCCILALCIIIVAIAIDRNFKDLKSNYPIVSDNSNNNKPGHNYIDNENQSDYRIIESNMIKSAQNYIAAHYTSGTPDGTRLTISVKSLQKDNKLSLISDPVNSSVICSGYVNVLRDNGIENYEPYLKCGDRYETSGYLERLDDNSK